MALSPGGQTLYVASGYFSGTDMLHALDANTLALRSASPSSMSYDSGLAYLAASKDGQCIYATDFAQHCVQLIDSSSLAITSSIPVGQGPLGICRSDLLNALFVCCFGDNSVCMIDLASMAVAGWYTGLTGPMTVVTGPDGVTAYAANAGSDEILVISPLNQPA
ncbi:MAG: YncE family protein [Pseudomonadota bacterium]